MATAQHHEQVPEGARIYAIGDIHGCADLLDRLHDTIREDGEDCTLRKTIVYLGDYIDRGPHSDRILETLSSKPLSGFEHVFLRGNHEDFLIRFLDEGYDGDRWLSNGGMATLASYSIGFPDPSGGNATMAARMAHIQKELLSKLPQHHERFLRYLKPFHVEGDYLFVHAGIRPGVPLQHQKEEDFYWIRAPFLESDVPFGKIVVHGHSVETEPETRSNRIGIDTGAYFTDRLTCLVLEGAERRFLTT